MRAGFLSSLSTLFFPLGNDAEAARNVTEEALLAKVRLEYAVSHHTYTALSYADPHVRALIRANKYENDAYAARLLRQVLALTLEAVFDDHALALSGQRLLVVPTPTAPKRARERGRHQVKALCKSITLPLSAEYADVLERVNRPSQITVPKEERAKNIAGAFSVPPRHHPLIQGSAVFVVDDVSETGATMLDTMRALREAGAGEVAGIALAR